MPVGSIIAAAIAGTATLVAGGMSASSSASAQAEAKQMYGRELEQEAEQQKYDCGLTRMGLGLQKRQLDLTEQNAAYQQRMGREQMKKQDQDKLANMLLFRANNDENFKNSLWARWRRG